MKTKLDKIEHLNISMRKMKIFEIRGACHYPVSIEDVLTPKQYEEWNRKRREYVHGE